MKGQEGLYNLVHGNVGSRGQRRPNKKVKKRAEEATRTNALPQWEEDEDKGDMDKDEDEQNQASRLEGTFPIPIR